MPTLPAYGGAADSLAFVEEVEPFGGSPTPDGGALESMISVRLREELQKFASKALRQELCELRSQLRSDVRTELENVLDDYRDIFSSPMPNHRRPILTKNYSSHMVPMQLAPKESWATNNLIDVADISPKPQTTKSGSMKRLYRAQTGSLPSVAAFMNQIKQLKNLVSESTISLTKKSDKELRECWSSESDSRPNELEVLPGEVFRSTEFRPTEFRPTESIRSSVEAMRTDPSSASVARDGRGANHASKARHYRTKRTGEALRNVVKAEEGSWTAKVCGFIAAFLEHSIIVVIFLNGVFIGVQTEYQAHNVTESVPGFFPVIEAIFAIVFTAELVLKLVAYRGSFFTMKDWQWNVFDTFLVLIQLLEIVGMMTTDHESNDNNSSNVNVSFLRLLRILRLFRVLRLVRLLHFVGELATIVSSIANSFRALCWTVVLLVLMIYMVGVLYTQIVFAHRVANKESDGDASLARWWGSLGRSVSTLYQAILGGVDWESVVTPLEDEIHPLMSLSFCFYIAFALLAMMNIITGTFVQSALQNAENEKTQDFVTAARDVFAKFDEDHQTGLISQEQFLEQIDDDSFRSYIENIGIDPKDAKLLFRLLDNEHTGWIPLEILIAGMVRLRDGAKFMDILKLMNETERTGRKLDETVMNLEANLPRITALTQQIAHGSDNFDSQYEVYDSRGSVDNVQPLMNRDAGTHGQGSRLPGEVVTPPPVIVQDM